MILHLRAAVEQLYAVTPAEFTALRTRLATEAKGAGEAALATSVTKLRKPTVAAWAVNHFVRDHGEVLDDLRAFAELLREAQRTLDAEQLRTLGRERASRVDAVADQVADLASAAGHPLGAGVAQEVRETLTALVSDEAAEASVLTGALVRALSYSGFGSVDIDDVVALHDADLGGDRQRSRPALSVLRGGRSESSEDPDASDAAAATAERARLTTRLDTAREALRAADRQVAVLGARQEEVHEGIADLERRLDAARARLEKVTGELTDANGIRDRAQQRHDDAAAALADFASAGPTV
ncbi:MAG: hypothetical protein ABI336_03820 [Humibacillus sp.]